MLTTDHLERAERYFKSSKAQKAMPIADEKASFVPKVCKERKYMRDRGEIFLPSRPGGHLIYGDLTGPKRS